MSKSVWIQASGWNKPFTKPCNPGDPLIRQIGGFIIGATGWDTSDAGPGWLDMLYFGLTVPIRNNSWETATLFQELLAADHARADAPAYESYFVNLDFGSVKDAALQKRLENMPTSLALRREQVDDLRRGAREALRESREFARLLKALR